MAISYPRTSGGGSGIDSATATAIANNAIAPYVGTPGEVVPAGETVVVAGLGQYTAPVGGATIPATLTAANLTAAGFTPPTSSTTGAKAYPSVTRGDATRGNPATFAEAGLAAAGDIKQGDAITIALSDGTRELNVAVADGAFSISETIDPPGAVTYTVTLGTVTGGTASVIDGTVSNGESTQIVAADGFAITSLDAGPGTLLNGIVYTDPATANQVFDVTVAAVSAGDDARLLVYTGATTSTLRDTLPTLADIQGTPASVGVGSFFTRTLDSGIRQTFRADSTTTFVQYGDDDLPDENRPLAALPFAGPQPVGTGGYQPDDRIAVEVGNTVTNYRIIEPVAGTMQLEVVNAYNSGAAGAEVELAQDGTTVAASATRIDLVRRAYSSRVSATGSLAELQVGGEHWADLLPTPILPTNTGAQNTAAWAAMLALGIEGTLKFRAGTYRFAVNGASPINPTKRFCCLLQSNLWLVGDARDYGTVTLMLDDNQLVDGQGVVDLFVGGATGTMRNFGFENLTLDGNTANQPGWTGADVGGGRYQQTGVAGCLVNIGADSATTHPSANFSVRRVQANNCFSNPFNLHDCDTWYIEKLSVDDVGEGFQCVRSFRGTVRDYIFANTNAVCVGDGFEVSAGAGLVMTGFDIRDVTGGSAADIAMEGSIVTNGRIDNCLIGMQIQPDGGGGSTNPNQYTHIANVEVTNTIGDGVNINSRASETDPPGAEPPHTGPNIVRLSNVKVSNAGSRGFLIARIPPFIKYEGEITFENCSAVGCVSSGLQITNTDRITVIGGDYSNNGEEGILINAGGIINAGDMNVTIDGAICNNNATYGVNAPFVAAAHFPIGSVRASCRGNASGNMATAYFAERDAITWLNTSPTPLRNRGGTAGIAVLGETMLIIDAGSPSTTIDSLSDGFDGQRLKIFFDVAGVVTWPGFGGGRNVNLVGSTTNHAIPAQGSFEVIYSSATGEWHECGDGIL